MRVIGLTGGVGAGKSRILKLLEQDYHAEVIQADLVAKELEEPGQPGYKHLIEALGTGILDDSGLIDRERLAAMIFSREEVRRTVNSILHPMTWEVIKNKITDSERSLVVVEAALSDEKSDDIYDELWYVYTSKEERIKRLFAARGYSQERSLAIMDSQPSDAEYRTRADYTIDNNGTLDSAAKQIKDRLGKRQETP